MVELQIRGIKLGPELGHGAHSVVYRAAQGDTACAVKVPRGKGRWTRWVYRDAVSLARVRHPGLPRVLEVGVVDDLPYLVSELVVGETLEERIRHGALDEPEALRIVGELVETLASLHDVGLVHRDVRPRNILLTPSGRVRLVDVSISSPNGRSGGEHSAAPSHVAPEQFHASTPIDGRADLYSIGQVLLECGTGRAPVSNGKVAKAIASAPFSNSFRQIITGLVGEDPETRYPDARALLSELDRVRGGHVARGPTAYLATSKGMASLGTRQGDGARLSRAWVDVAATGIGSVAVVEGARGGGKTTLLTSLAQTGRELGIGRVLSVSCRFGDPPLALLRRILEAHLMTLGRSTRTDRLLDEAALREAASGYLSGFATLIAPKLAAVLGDTSSSVEPAPGGFPEGAAELITRLARVTGPLLLCVDDIQWVDPISRQVILRLAHRAPNEPLLLVLSSRPAGPGDAFLGELDPRQTLRVELSPLEDTEIAELIATHLGETEARPELARQVASLADGTPLGVFEVLAAMLDLGALRPFGGGWTVDLERTSKMVLPDGSLALLRRRLREVPAATRRVLEMAALLGTEFDDGLLARVVEIAPEDLRYALAEARRAGLLERGSRGCHRFVHDSAREMLTSAMEGPDLRQLHVRIAQCLDVDAADPEALYAAATHYGAGDLEKIADRAYRAARKAAHSALSRFDNETALAFLDLAKRAGEIAGIAKDVGFHRSIGEANLRLGALEESLAAFESALECERNPLALAAIFGRVAWVEQARGKPERAWAALGRAFELLGSKMPLDTPVSAALTLRDVVLSEVSIRLGRGESIRGYARAKAELLCSLHYQNSRLGLEYGKPQRLIESAILALEHGARLPPSHARAGSMATYGWVLMAMGLRARGSETLKKAELMAVELGDPIIIARCTQSRASSSAFAGQIDGALDLMRQCVETHAPWLEANEYCLNATSGELLESVRGRADEAWGWITRAIERQRRSYRTTAVFDQVLVHRARACLASLGQTAEPGSWLSRELERTVNAAPPIGDFYRGLFWGARARALVDEGNLGPAFQSLVQEFESEGHNPRTVHPSATEYYVAVGHGRVHQFLRARAEERELHLRNVERATADLTAAARVPLQRAHALFLQGFVATFRGRRTEGERRFSEAEAVAREANVPWVFHAIARARAHHLRAEGKIGPAMDQARIAEMFAREHGAAPRARWVREEFDLPNPTPSLVPSSEPETSRTEVYRTALLRMLRAPELHPEQQGAAMLSDLLRDLDADRGFIVFQPDGSTGSKMVLSKNRRGDESSETESWRQHWLESIRVAGQPWPSLATSSPVEAFGQRIDPLRVLAVPLLLGESLVGATSLERAPSSPIFTAQERDLFLLLSRPMAIALEVAQLFVERDQLLASLRQAQKMEAVGQVAGGMAHDFTNMLNTIGSAVSSIQGNGTSDRDVAAALADISKATESGGRLLRQLLSFSRHQAVSPRSFAANDLITDLLPMLRRLAGERVTVTLKLDPETDPIMVVRSSFDQALVNLVVNARDAMPNGGTVTIATRAAILDGAATTQGSTRTGPHLVVDVLDTGQGISPEHLHQVFDPFFTTKSAGSGTGLGLTTVYAFVRNSGGHVELKSSVGQGTTVSMFFPMPDSSVGLDKLRPRPSREARA